MEQFGDAEIALQFEVRPVIERIAQRVGNGSRPGQKFLVGRGVPVMYFSATPLARMARHL